MPINTRDKDVYLNYVCPDCFHTPDECTCAEKNGYELDIIPYCLITIDRRIQEHLQVLCEKGYGTEFSCESHNPHDNVYICFVMDYGFGKKLPMPEGFTKRKYKGDRRCFIEAGYGKTKREQNKVTDEQFESMKAKHLNDLLDWCKKLPRAKKIEIDKFDW